MVPYLQSGDQSLTPAYGAALKSFGAVRFHVERSATKVDHQNIEVGG